MMRMLQILISLVLLAWLDIHSAAAAESVVSKSSDSPGLRLLEEIQTVITDLAESAKPSVVNLIPLSGPGRGRELPQERAPNASGSGSGVIIDPDGHIITNSHVIGDATEIEVRFSDKSKLIAQVVGKDLDTDLAVLKVTADHPLPSARFGDSSAVRVGQWVLAVGNPFGLDRTVTLGVVSGVGRENINLSRYENFIQTDASINPGNSGGPLFNLRGEIIGINTAIINFAQGIGFAIPSNMAKQVIEQLLTQGRVTRGWLGVGIQPLTVELARKFGVNEGEGVLVNEVFEKDPAAAAGIKPGDIHCNLSSPGWAKHAWSCFFAPWNAEATVFVINQSRFSARGLLDAGVRGKNGCETEGEVADDRIRRVHRANQRDGSQAQRNHHDQRNEQDDAALATRWRRLSGRGGKADAGCFHIR